jgi:hypothetical protein
MRRLSPCHAWISCDFLYCLKRRDVPEPQPTQQRCLRRRQDVLHLAVVWLDRFTAYFFWRESGSGNNLATVVSVLASSPQQEQFICV